MLLENIPPAVSCTTSDKSISAVPSNETPCMVLAVASAVAVAARFTAISDVPSKDVPPIVLAVSKAVAVAALPVVFWLSVPTTKSIVPSAS